MSRTALKNAYDILRVLEREHQKEFNIALTLGRLGEALVAPRVPDRGERMKYDPTLAASLYLKDDIAQLERIYRKEGQRYYDL